MCCKSLCYKKDSISIYKKDPNYRVFFACRIISKKFNSEEIAEFEKELCEFLLSLSEQGSGDDVSIVILSHNEEKNSKKDKIVKILIIPPYT